MLMHGRLILTAHGCMLDEVKSLLQKSLRRKNKVLVTKAAKELVGYGKDQLPWKCLVTYLFEDHCLSDVKVLESFHECFVNRDKLGAVMLLYDCYTCRVAACLPVIAMEDKYTPNFWNPELKCDQAECGLVTSISATLNFDLILAHLKQSWQEKNTDQLITCIKLCTIVMDVEKRSVTNKGQGYLIGTAKKPNIGHVIMSLLNKNSTDFYWKKYTQACFKLLNIPEICIRLVLSSVVANLMFVEQIKPVSEHASVNWSSVEPLTTMPIWAVDKHTYRGKYGRGTRHLLNNSRIKSQLKQTHPTMTEEEVEEFHGDRTKSGIREFFEQGCICNRESLGENGNPYWDQTKEIYYRQPPKLQKTTNMTKVYYDLLKVKYRSLFNNYNKSKDLAEGVSGGQGCRVLGGTGFYSYKLKRKNDEVESTSMPPNKKKKGDTSNKSAIDKKGWDKLDTTSTKDTKHKEITSISLKGPLLQLPTGSAKVYTCVSLETNEVWKGPYKAHRYDITLFYQCSLEEVLGDVHTLKVREEKPYLVFPLVKGEGCSLKVTTRDFYDCISKQQVTEGQFINREDLGLVQLHRLKPQQISSLPHTIWLHFIYRFLLNIGDSGLYNAITDSKLMQIYGIDLEESRLKVKGSRPVDLMFTKLPAKAVCEKVMSAVISHKDLLRSRMSELGQDSLLLELQTLATRHNVEFNGELFEQRVQDFTKALDKLGDPGH